MRGPAMPDARVELLDLFTREVYPNGLPRHLTAADAVGAFYHWLDRRAAEDEGVRLLMLRAEEESETELAAAPGWVLCWTIGTGGKPSQRWRRRGATPAAGAADN